MASVLAQEGPGPADQHVCHTQYTWASLGDKRRAGTRAVTCVTATGSCTGACKRHI